MKPQTVHSGALLALISLPIFIGALDLTVVSAVLPHVILDLEIPLQAGLDDAAWMVTGYLLAYSISMTFMGRLSDLYGRRRVYLIALAIFAFGSYLVAVADGFPTRLAMRLYYLFASGRADMAYVSLYTLVAARMIQAFGAGAMVPVGMALVGDIFPENRRAQPIGLIAAMDTAGWVVGHLYGGIVARFFPWQMIFWLNLPICLLAFLLIWYAMRSIPQERGEGKMDWLGALLIAIALCALNVGLGAGIEKSAPGFIDPSRLPSHSLPLILTSLLFFGLFLRWQGKTKYPLVDLSLFKRKNYPAASLSNFLIGFSLFIAIANVPLFVNALIANDIEQGAWDSGWLLSALTVPLALASVPGGWLTDKLGYRLPALLGLILSVFGFALMRAWQINSTYFTMAAHLAITGVGLGLTMSPIATAVINASPPRQRGVSSALVIIFRLLGMTIGVSSITTYGLLRADQLSIQWTPVNAGLNETVRIGMEVAEKVIGETFIIAGVVAFLAIIPVLFLNSHLQTDEVKK